MEGHGLEVAAAASCPRSRDTLRGMDQGDALLHAPPGSFVVTRHERQPFIRRRWRAVLLTPKDRPPSPRRGLELLEDRGSFRAQAIGAYVFRRSAIRRARSWNGSAGGVVVLVEPLA